MTYPFTPVYCVTYDLKKPGQSYAKLYEVLKNSPKWWHFLQSTWLIQTNESAQQLYDRLKPHLDPNDFVLVIEIRNNAQGWLPKEAWDWINENVSR